MQNYRKKQVVVGALRLPDTYREFVKYFFLWTSLLQEDLDYVVTLDGVEILTPEGVMLAGWGDWIIKGVEGEYYPCKNSIFKRTYEEVND